MNLNQFEKRVKMGKYKYKSIMLPAKLQEKIKLLATRQNKTIITFLEELLKVFK